jgi:hypothetical protein
LLEEQTRWLAWLRSPGVLRLQRADGPLLRAALEQLVQQGRALADETTTLVQELDEP